MKSAETIHDILSAYIKGELSAQENAHVYKQIQSDPAFKIEYENILLVNDLVLQHKITSIQNICNEEFQSFERRNKLKKYMFATSAFLVIGTAVFYWLANTPKIAKPKQTETELEPTIIKEPKETIIETPVFKEKHSIKPLEKLKVTEKKQTIDTNVVSTATNKQPDKESKIDETAEINTDKTMAVARPKPSLATDKTINCEQNVPNWSLEPNSTCTNSKDGTVVLHLQNEESIGSTKILSMDKEEMNNNDLAAGNYTFEIVDLRNCRYTKSFRIDTKLCPVDYKLNPDFGEDIDFSGKEGILSISNQAGELYFQANLEQLDNYRWNGRSNNGNIDDGLFIFRIEKDNQQIEFGTITIIR